MKGKTRATCETCGRDVPLTFHHLIPRKMHRRAHFRRNFSKEDLNEGVYLCRRCHTGIHKTYDEMTLAKEFNSINTLLEDEALARHFQWVARQKS
ncbi:MAG: HNH endonuclease [Pseudomonadota bacterium]